MNKPLIIAICGKSATGKDTLARALKRFLTYYGFSANIIVSDTTRPHRVGEVDGVDYNFLTHQVFRNKIDNHEYLEYAIFNNWLYGTNKKSIQPDMINIGVFNLNGISSLANHIQDYRIVCIYLTCGWYKRLWRSICRENKISYEFLRRLYVDYINFKLIDFVLRRFSKCYFYSTNRQSTRMMVDKIIRRLEIDKIIPYIKRR